MFHLSSTPKSLKYAGLYSYNLIDDAAFKQLGPALARLKNLQFLDLR